MIIAIVRAEQPTCHRTIIKSPKRENDPCTHFLRVLRLPFGNVVTSLPNPFSSFPLSDVQALVLDPLAAVAVRVLEAEVIVVAELFGEDVICSPCQRS